MFLSTDHFSQLVWRNSKELGIGTAQSKSGNFFLVARYNPPGNIEGQFEDNIPVEKVASDESRQDTKGNSNPSNTAPGKISNVGLIEFLNKVKIKLETEKYIAKQDGKFATFRKR